MELEEYLQNNNVTLWRNNRALGPQKTKSLADFDYAEGLENITGKMVWICDYRANADPTKKPIRGIEPTPVVVTDAKETNKIIYYSPIYFRPVKNGHIKLLRPATLVAPNAECGCALSVRHARTSTILRNLSAPR